MEPDSWEEIENAENRMSNLNINAASFVPNAFAPAFVPRFGGSPAPAPTQTNGFQEGIPKAEPVNDSNFAEHKEAKIISMDEESPKLPEPEESSMDEPEVEGEPMEPTESASEAAAMEACPVIVKKQSKPKAKRKDNVNIVFIGHVDAGKSTIGGHILYLTGQVDKRTLEKYEKEAKEMNRESWYLSWALDTNDEERDKGKTVEVGRGYFETDKKRFTLLDAPGHKCFVSNMIGGAAQADVGILVISARKGEFETGFDRGGQTREHALLIKTAGVKHLIILINKMDDPSVGWDKNRYDEIVNRLGPFLKQNGFRPSDIKFMPASGLTGANLKEKIDPAVCPWYDGLPFLSYLDSLPSFKQDQTGKPFRMSIVEKYRDMGTFVMGKVISGIIAKNENLTIMPNKTTVQVTDVLIDDEDSEMADCGDNVKLKLKNIEEEDVSAGMVLCSLDNHCKIADRFLAKIQLVELRNIIAPGFNCIMHIHNAVVEVSFQELVGLFDKKTGKRMIDKEGKAVKPRCAKERDVVFAKLQCSSAICIESFDQFPQMGRFTLRDEGKTIAVGMVLKASDQLFTVSNN